MLEFYPGTTAEDMEYLGIDPGKALAVVLAHNVGRDAFETFVIDAARAAR